MPGGLERSVPALDHGARTPCCARVGVRACVAAAGPARSIAGSPAPRERAACRGRGGRSRCGDGALPTVRGGVGTAVVDVAGIADRHRARRPALGGRREPRPPSPFGRNRCGLAGGGGRDAPRIGCLAWPSADCAVGRASPRTCGDPSRSWWSGRRRGDGTDRGSCRLRTSTGGNRVGAHALPRDRREPVLHRRTPSAPLRHWRVAT